MKENKARRHANVIAANWKDCIHLMSYMKEKRDNPISGRLFFLQRIILALLDFYIVIHRHRETQIMCK